MLDEPSLGLRRHGRGDVRHAAASNELTGRAILLVEQNAALALEISRRAYVLEAGAVVLSGASADLANDPRVQAAYLGG